MFIYITNLGHPFFPLHLLFNKSNHSTLLEIHSSKGTSQYGGRDNISGTATRYGLTVRGSSPSGARFPVSVRTDYEISGLFCKRWRPWCIYIFTNVFSRGSGLSLDESILWSRSLGLESISLEPMAPFVKTYQNCMVVWWLTLSNRREKGDMWTQRK